MTAEEIARALPKFRKSGQGYLACCPAHEDDNPSLSITEGRDGKPLVHCFAGCEQAAVIAGLKNLGLWPEHETKIAPRIVTEYSYTDEVGSMLYQVVRYEPKNFKQRYPDRVGNWIWKKHPQQVLYHLPEVLENPIILVVEGERDCETLRAHGFVATTNSGGANAPWLDRYTECLRGREVILIPDRDPAGYDRVKKIAQALFGKVARLVYLELEDGKDVTEWFARGHSEVELIAQLDGSEVSQ